MEKKDHQAFREIIKLLIVPFTLLSVYLIVLLIWTTLNFPQAEEFVKIIQDYFNTYGLWIVFTGALIEGFFILGQYFPGSTIIFIGIISAGKDAFRAVEIVAIICIAFIIAYYGDYLVGKYGWYKLFLKFGIRESLERAQRKVSKHLFKGIISSYWEPDLATLAATAAGILQVPAKRFLIYSTIGVLIWLTFWGTLVFMLGQAALQLMGVKYILVMFVIWVIAIIIAHFIEKKNERNSV